MAANPIVAGGGGGGAAPGGGGGGGGIPFNVSNINESSEYPDYLRLNKNKKKIIYINKYKGNVTIPDAVILPHNWEPTQRDKREQERIVEPNSSDKPRPHDSSDDEEEPRDRWAGDWRERERARHSRFRY